jgi:hypothetical protein
VDLHFRSLLALCLFKNTDNFSFATENVQEFVVCQFARYSTKIEFFGTLRHTTSALMV